MHLTTKPSLQSQLQRYHISASHGAVEACIFKELLFKDYLTFSAGVLVYMHVNVSCIHLKQSVPTKLEQYVVVVNCVGAGNQIQVL